MNNNFTKYITIFVSITVFWLLGIPYLFSKTLPVVCENISYNTNYTVYVKNPKLRLSILPTAVFLADEININSKKSDENCNIIFPNIKLRLLPLLSGRLHINRIMAYDVNVNVKLKQKLVLDKNFFYNLNNSKIKCDNFQIDNFHIKAYSPDIETFGVYIGKNLFYKKTNRFLKFSLDSQTEIHKQISSVKLNLYLPKNDQNKGIADIKISQLNLSALKDFLKYYLPSDITEINGFVNINASENHLNGNFKNLSVIFKDDAKSMIFPKNFDIISDFSLTRQKIKIDNAEFKSKNIHCGTSGTISNLIDKSKSTINMNIRIDKSKIEDFISLLPTFKTEDIDSYKLKKHKFYGDIIGNLSLKGDIMEPSILGNIYVSNGILTKPIPNADGATIKLNFIGKYLNFDVLVPAGSAEKVWVKGGVELYNVKYSDMHIWSTQKVDLSITESKIIPLHEILNFVIGPVPIMSTQGNGNIDITVKGNRKNPHTWGVLNLNDVTTKFLGIPDLTMTNANATLIFNDENAVFKLKNGLVNGLPININGTCNLAGKFDFDVDTKNQELKHLYKAIETSTIIDDVKKMMPKFDEVNGLCNLSMKVLGNIKDISLIEFNKNFSGKGVIELLGNSFTYEGTKVNNIVGNINFDGLNAGLDLTGKIGNSMMSIKTTLKDNLADLAISIPHLNAADVCTMCDKSITGIIIDTVIKYKGSINNIDYNKIDLSAKIIKTLPENKLKIQSGEIYLKNGNLNIKNLLGFFEDSKSKFNIDINANNIISKPIVDGHIVLKDFELKTLNGHHAFLPKELISSCQQINFKKGKINLEARISRNNINASTNLGGIEFTYSPYEMPVKIINGSVYIRKNLLRIDKLNLIADDMPILFDGNINNIFSKRDFNLYLNCKPQQNFIDKYINTTKIYPVKLKGDIVASAKLKGTLDDFNIKSQINMAKDSSLYYMGATIGDIENSILLELDMDIIKNRFLKIREFSYDKVILSQNSKQTRMNMLKTNGEIDVEKDNLILHDLHVKTSNPTDARIFNIIFRKPNIKQGQFTSNLRINGKLTNPKILGNFHIFETNIPFLDTTLKNITFIFKDNFINLTSKGEVFGNEITFNGKIKNKLTSPYYIEDAVLVTKELDLNNIINKLKMSQVDNYQSFESLEGFNLANFVIKNLQINADKIQLRNIVANNFSSNTSITDKQVININNFKFYMAKGIVNGSFSYDIKTNNTKLKLNANSINANDLSYAIFDLNNQIYGDLTGMMDLSCNGTNFNNCMQTLNGNTTFNVSDGKMPKLGSLEYLLKAGNLLKGGITSVSINGIIDIITPLKTGDFSNIYGTIDIKNGIAQDIEIATKGKDLSLFITGKYNFSTSNAEMEVLGMLSKKISTMFGPVGNVSINTLFNIIPGINLSNDSHLLKNINKIPGIELNNKQFRKFVAEIKGNINSEGYVRSFSWIN